MRVPPGMESETGRDERPERKRGDIGACVYRMRGYYGVQTSQDLLHILGTRLRALWSWLQPVFSLDVYETHSWVRSIGHT